MSSPLAPFIIDAAHPWDAAAAGHLLRRAGFAPSREELAAALDHGLEAAVDALLDDADEHPRCRELDDVGPTLARRNNIQALRGWWLTRLRYTRRPLHARLALFWHNHFATSNRKVQSVALMYQQLRTLERHALGNFADLAAAIARDPAMIIWLDGDQNEKGRPNENFAREWFELFSLGVGHYTEHDIREAARAFTGFHQNRGVFTKRASAHDIGTKTIFGQSSEFSGDDVIRLTLEQPAAARFLAAKLLREFLTPEPDEMLIDTLATRLRETNFDIGATLRTLLTSAALFEPAYRNVRIKSPVELIVGAARSFDLHVNAPQLENTTRQLGQPLLEPPSVKGWDGHRAWLNAATMLVRLNLASRASTAEHFDADAFCTRHEIESASAAARTLGEIAFAGQIPPSLETALRDLPDATADAARAALTLLVGSPEYQFA